MMPCQVKVIQGILEGMLCKTYYGKEYYSFEGIPYAKPPIGDLRFKAPIEPDSWTGVRDAKKPGDKCAQLNPFGKGVLEGSEDCLYLNVYTPSLPHEKNENLPVIFFVHGGRLVVGYGDYYKPDYLIKNDVILVTINYRLNVFGFLCLNTPEVPGNAGLKDTVMALKWVKSNISSFNGDSNNITVFGESAGAAIVSSYLTSKMAANLYNKVICQSGVSVSDLYVDHKPNENASNLAHYLGYNVTDKMELYELLRNTSAEDLVNAYVSAELDRPPAVINAFLLPVVEKYFEGVERFFEEPPQVAISENRFEKVPIIVTINSFESALFMNRDENGDIIYEDLQYFVPFFLRMDRGTPDAIKIANKLQNYYFQGKKLDRSMKLEYLNLTTEHYFTRDTILFMEMVAKYHKDLYLCRFDYNGNVSTGTMKNMGLQGASHGDLVQYIFYRNAKLKNATENDKRIIDMVTEAWCSFAKYGELSWTDQKTRWLPYSREEKLCLNIDNKGVVVKRFPNFERIQFWFDLTDLRAKL